MFNSSSRTNSIRAVSCRNFYASAETLRGNYYPQASCAHDATGAVVVPYKPEVRHGRARRKLAVFPDDYPALGANELTNDIPNKTT
uniref:Uncharacterized protein n=1 Tax=Mycena chlorophos TaxID=658473 RepID=A0ABQ0MBI4_MYCCL|nr:predicted protein [Mycena chlorophos]